MTDQVSFDRHLRAVLGVTVGLVNILSDGWSHGAAYTPPPAATLRHELASLLARYSSTRPTLSDADVRDFRSFAATARGIFNAVVNGDMEDAAVAINELLAVSGARPQLDRQPDGTWQLHFHGHDDSVAVGWSAGCASGLALVLGSNRVGRLGVCAAERCDRVFVDTSRNGRRRFCSTACQNRAKATVFRRRHAGRRPHDDV